MTTEPAGHSLLYFYRGEPDSCDPWAVTLEKCGWRVQQVPVSDFAPLRGVWEVLRRRDYAHYDVVAAAEYYLSWALCLRLLFRWKRPKVAALTFNQSKRLLLTGIRPLDRLLNRIWRRASMFLVHSRDEATRFSRIHDIPLDRFVFSRWGFDLPAHDQSKTAVPIEPYVTMVGRNNRDLMTFCSAVERAKVKGVLITAGYMLDRQPVQSSDVLVLADRPMDECLNYVAGSFAHLVLVMDAQRGAGHISAVSAMLLGKPQVFSAVPPLADYLTDDFNGIAVPIGDVEAVTAAIRTLRDDRHLGERLGRNGQRFAVDQLSYDAATSRAIKALSRLASS